MNWLDILLDYSFDVVYCPGILQTLPDALSRMYPPFLRLKGVDSSEASNDEKQPQVATSTTTTSTKPISTIDELVKAPDQLLLRLVKERFNKKCPPKGERSSIIDQAHSEGHFGSEYIFNKIWNDGVYWPGLKTDCLDHVANCIQCLRFNVSKRGFHPMQSINAKFPFDHVALDLLQLMMTARGHNYMLICVDVATRYVVLVPLTSKLAANVGRALWFIMCWYGVPKIIQSDNGSEFVNSTIKAINNLMGVSHRTVAPYNPRANGLAEGYVKIAKKALLKMLEGNMTNWDLFTPGLMAALNARMSGSLRSPAFCLFHRRPRNAFTWYGDAQSDLLSPEEMEKHHEQMLTIVHPEILELLKKKQKRSAEAKDKQRVLVAHLEPGTKVMLKDQHRSNKMEPVYLGPYTVTRRTKANTYHLVDNAQISLTRPVPIAQLKVIAKPDPQSNIYIKQPEAEVETMSPSPVRARSRKEERTATPEVYIDESGRELFKRSFEIEKVLEHKTDDDGDLLFRIRWKGYGAADDTWQSFADFDDITILHNYWKGRNQLAAVKAKTRKSKKQRRKKPIN